MSGSRIRDVGVVGLGIIGSRVAANLRRTSFNVFVWNRSVRAVPGFVSSPAEVAELTRVIQIFVRDADALRQVVEEMRPVLGREHLLCCHSTVSAEAVKDVAAIAAAAGAGFLDAPFTGSKLAAEKGELVYYVSGETEDLEKAAPVLRASSRKILHFGTRPGDATVLKIATNLLSGAIVGALAEALAITRSQGVDPAQLLAAFQDNANCSPLITMKLPAMTAASYEPHFSLKNMLKDARYAQLLAKAGHLATPVLDASAAALEEAEARGQGELDYSVVFENYSETQAAPIAENQGAPEAKPEPIATLALVAASLTAPAVAPGEGPSTEPAPAPLAEPVPEPVQEHIPAPIPASLAAPITESVDAPIPAPAIEVPPEPVAAAAFVPIAGPVIEPPAAPIAESPVEPPSPPAEEPPPAPADLAAPFPVALPAPEPTPEPETLSLPVPESEPELAAATEPPKPAAKPIKIRIAKEKKWHTLKASVFDEAAWDKETA